MKDAKDYATENKAFADALNSVSENYAFERTLPEDDYATILDSRWKDGGRFEDLPSVVKNGGATKYLFYRVVESKIAYKTAEDANPVEINLNLAEPASNTAKGEYTYVEADEDSLFEPGYVNNGPNSASTETHKNILNTTSLTITKEWDDNNNFYETRPEEGGQWVTYFVVERKTADGDAWEMVMETEIGADSISSKKPLIVRVTGTGNESSSNVTISGLPGGDFIYRARELEPKKDGGYVAPDEGGIAEVDYYENAYTPTYGAGTNADGSMTASASNALRTTDIYAEKQWIGADRPESVELQLQYQTGPDSWETLKPIPLNDTVDSNAGTGLCVEYDEWKAVWKNVPEYMPGSYRGADGTKPTTYRVIETVPDGYIQVGKTKEGTIEVGEENYKYFTITNMKSVSLTVQKTWAAETDDQEEVTALLWRTTKDITASDYNYTEDESKEMVQIQGGQAAETQEEGEQHRVRLNAGNNWSVNISNLPKYSGNTNSAQPYYYFVTESTIGGTSVDEMVQDSDLLSYSHTFTRSLDANQFTTEILNIGYTDVTGTKTWVDNSNRYNTRPDSITLTLQRRTNAAEEWEDVTTDDHETALQPRWTNTNTNVWTYTYEDLPYANAEGKKYTYQVVETVPEVKAGANVPAGTSYEAAYDDDTHLNITNTLTGTTQITVTKEWLDGNNETGKRPASITLYLYANDELDRTAIIEDSGQGLFAGLMEILLRNGDRWTYTFEDLDVYDEDGKEIKYEVREAKVYGYEPEMGELTAVTVGEGTADETTVYTITLTNTMQTEVPVHKIWGGVEETDQKDVVVGLYSQVNGQAEPVQVTNSTGDPVTRTLNADNDWKDTFTNLPAYDQNDQRIRYSVKEETVGGQLADQTDYRIVIAEEPQADDSGQPGYRISNIRRTKLSGTKTWLDDNDALGRRPEELSLQLYRSTDPTANRLDTTPNAAWAEVTEAQMTAEGIYVSWNKQDPNVWTYTYRNLPAADENGALYVYDVKESGPEGYALIGATPSNAGGRDFANQLSNTEFSVSGVKTWEDGANASGGRPASLVLNLWRQIGGGSPEYVVETPVWSGIDGSHWTYTLIDIRIDDSQGRKYTYWVEEAETPGYDAYYDAERLNVTNRLQGGLKLSKTVSGTAGRPAEGVPLYHCPGGHGDSGHAGEGGRHRRAVRRPDLCKRNGADCPDPRPVGPGRRPAGRHELQDYGDGRRPGRLYYGKDR